LLFGAAGEHVAHRLVVHGANETAAVEAGFRRIAAAAIGDAKEADGRDHQVGSSFGDGLTDLLELPDQTSVGEHAGHLVIGSVLWRGCMGSESKQEGRG
jgi:hypothetical protein